MGFYLTVGLIFRNILVINWGSVALPHILVIKRLIIKKEWVKGIEGIEPALFAYETNVLTFKLYPRKRHLSLLPHPPPPLSFKHNTRKCVDLDVR